MKTTKEKAKKSYCATCVWNSRPNTELCFVQSEYIDYTPGLLKKDLNMDGTCKYFSE